MDILIISLTTQTDRRTFQEQQMAKLGLSFKFLDAVSYTTLSEEAYRSLKDTWERPMRKAEVCCFLSHKAAWEKVLRGNAPVLILEDDAVLSTRIHALLDSIETTPVPYDLIVLETRHGKKIISKAKFDLNDDFKLRALYQDRTGSAAYVVTPTGARKLLEKASQGIAANADAFISSLYALDAYQVTPAAAIQLDMCEIYGCPAPIQTTTSIGAVERPAAESGKWRFKCRRIFGQLRIARRILSVVHKAERIHIEPQLH